MPGNRLSQDAVLQCLGYEQITVSTVAIGFTVSKLIDAVRQKNVLLAVVVIDATANSGIRWRADSVAPTSAIGVPTPIATYNSFRVWGVDDLKNFLAVRGNQASAVDTVMYVSYFG